MTREQWLNKMATKLEPMFRAKGFPIPKKIRISCGWPLGKALRDGKGTRTIGQCFPPSWSADKHTEIFISPCLDDAKEVSSTLIHELVHAAVGCEHGHKGPFKKLAVSLGLEGKMTETVAGKDLAKRLNALSRSIGKYPHSTLDGSKRKKQGTRLIKLECWTCGYVVRTTAKWIETGLPTCACGGKFKEE